MFTRPRIIPVLLIDDRDCIKTVQFGECTYLGDVVNAVKIFNRKGIDELAILDIGATKNHREPDFELLKDIAGEAFMPLSCGGGVTTIDHVHQLLAIGYEKVVINTSLITKSDMVREAVRIYGSQSIVASIDAKLSDGEYKCVICDGQQVIDKHPRDLAIEAEQKELSAEVAELEEKFSTIRQDEEDVTMFMERLRKYTDVQELTREMCSELIEYITLDAYVEGQPREIYIYYKLLDEPLKDKRSLF